jgi:2,4-dienoyl-CoA reductase (NADPH2)
MKRVEMIAGAAYRRIDDRGLHITISSSKRVLEVARVVLCAGQVPNRALHNGVVANGLPVHLIGGADVVAEFDAKD